MEVSVERQLHDILEDYSLEVVKATNKAEKKVAEDCVQKLKNTSPKRSGRGKHYANGWTKKKGKTSAAIDSYVIYNKTKPQLTHLLENGHIIRNAKGTYGRVAPKKHIKPVEEYAADKLPKEIARELE